MALSASLPSQPSLCYATDEDILVYAGGDYATLCPPWNQLACGVDGAFAPGSPWVLTSASCDFQANGVAPNQVAWLTAPKGQYPGGGHFLAIDSVAGNSVTLRRPYKDLGVGQPAAPAAGLTGVSFNVLTFGPALSEATYDLNQRFAIDPNIAAAGTFRAPAYIYDLQVLRVAAVYTVLVERYAQEARGDRGDFRDKYVRFRQKLDDALARVQVRWGAVGDAAEPSTIFSCRLSR